MTAEHIDYAALQAAMNPAKENTVSTADEVRETLHSAAPLQAAMDCVSSGESFEEALERARDAEVGCLHRCVQRHPCGTHRCLTCGADVHHPQDRTGWIDKARPLIPLDLSLVSDDDKTDQDDRDADEGPELEPCPQPGCVTEGHHYHYKREDNGTAEVHWSWRDPSDSCDELEFVTACYTTRRPDEEALTTTTDLHTIDCRGIDPSRVQSVIDALADVITTARADR